MGKIGLYVQIEQYLGSYHFLLRKVEKTFELVFQYYFVDQSIFMAELFVWVAIVLLPIAVEGIE